MGANAAVEGHRAVVIGNQCQTLGRSARCTVYSGDGDACAGREGRVGPKEDFACEVLKACRVDCCGVEGDVAVDRDVIVGRDRTTECDGAAT